MQARPPSDRIAAAVRAVPRAWLSFLACLLACLAVDFELARTLLPNSDSVQAYNEMLAVRSGNMRLHAWVLATDNFLLTDLPVMVLASLLLGPGPRLIYLVPFIVFVLMLAACLALAMQGAEDRRQRLLGGYAILLLLGVPYGLHYNFFFWNDFHVATVTMCLYAVLAAVPALSGRRFNRLRLVPFTGLVFAVAFSDPLADGLLLAPLLMLVILRAWLDRALRLDHGLLLGCALLGLAAGLLALHGMTGLDAFSTVPSVGTGFVPDLAGLARNAHALIAGAQLLFMAQPGQIAAVPLHQLVAPSRLAVALTVAALSLAVIWRMPREPRSGVVQLLVIGALCLASLEAMSATFSLSVDSVMVFPGAATRYVVPPFVFLCTAAACEASRLLVRIRPRTSRLATSAGLGAAILFAAGAVPTAIGMAERKPGIRNAPQYLVADWLARRRLSYGIGDYWDTQLVQALSGGAVAAYPATQLRGRLVPFVWLTDAGPFGLGRRPQFVIVTRNDTFKVTLAAVTATYGQPTSVTEVTNDVLIARLPG